MDSKALQAELCSMIQQDPVKPSAHQYIELAKQIKGKNYSRLLKEGLQHYPCNHEIRSLLKAKNEKTFVLRKMIKKMIGKKAASRFFYESCINYLLNIEEKALAKKIAMLGIEQNKKNSPYLRFVTKKAMQIFDWKWASQLFPLLHDQEVTTTSLYDYSVCLQLLGQKKESKQLVETIRNENPEEYSKLFKDSYRKYIIFNNGKSRIELYKHRIPNERVVATFDTIDKTWHDIPFSFNLIKKNDMDLVALRRDHVRNFHQDLSREDYIDSTSPVFSTYEDKFAYGTSLGGYAALYFGSPISDIRILAMAPRNSANPDYGARTIVVKEPFKHISPHPVSHNPNITIVYDPQNLVDEPYIKHEILPSYPKARILQIPYAGHRVPRFLAQTKQLKPLVMDFLQKKPLKEIERGALRKKSSEYYWVVSDYCLQKNHAKWALDFAQHAKEMMPDFDRPYVSISKALVALKRLNEAIEFSKEAYDKFPKEYKFAILLAEAYIANGNREAAINVLEEFSSRKQVAKVKKMLSRLKKDLIPV